MNLECIGNPFVNGASEAQVSAPFHMPFWRIANRCFRYSRTRPPGRTIGAKL